MVRWMPIYWRVYGVDFPCVTLVELDNMLEAWLHHEIMDIAVLIFLTLRDLSARCPPIGENQ